MKRVYQFFGVAATALALQLPLLAGCPITDGATLVVRAPIGNLRVDTSGKGSVEASVNSKDIVIKEVCGKDRVEYTADAPSPMRGNVDWKIVVPRGVNLDLVTLGGSINMTDTDGSATLRTTGGSVTVGNIKGKAAIITQGGFIKAGDIGNSAEFRSSSSGSLEIGNVSGNADLHTAGGPIKTGTVSGKVTAESGGGAITIKGARGEVWVTTEAGDIFIGDASQITAKTAGGTILNNRVSGPAKVHTESGDIRLESAGASVEASTGYGMIYVKLNPVKMDGDIHVDLQTGVGDITIYIPERLKANVDAMIERPALNSKRITTDFPVGSALSVASTPVTPGRIPMPSMINRFSAPDRQQFQVNGGGNRVNLHTSLGKIEIWRIKM